MSYIRGKINPEVIVDAVEKSSRTLDEVKNRFKSFERWISQERDPTFNQLKDLSSYLRITFGYLLLQEHIPLLEFRTIDTEAIEHPS